MALIRRSLARDLRREGVGPVRSKAIATLTQLSKVLNEAVYFAQYPEDIDMLGLSFNTTSMRTGTAYFGEVAHHFDVPIAVHTGDLLPAILPGASREDPLPHIDLSEISLEEIATDFADKRIDGFIERDKTFLLVGATQ